VVVGSRDARSALDAASQQSATDKSQRAEDDVPLDPAALLSANIAALTLPVSSKEAPLDPAGIASTLKASAASALKADAAPVGAVGAAVAAVAAPVGAVVRAGAVAAPVTAVADSKADIASAKLAQAGIASSTPRDGAASVAGIAAANVEPRANASADRVKAEALPAALTASPIMVAAPASEASSAAATAKELLGDSVAKLKEALERSGSAVSAQSVAMAQHTQTATPTTVHSIDTPVGQPGWDSEFAGKLSQVVMLRNDRAEFHLHPAELGPVDVQISFASDQAVVLITAPHAATRDALEQTLPYLRDMLADQGITLGQASVQSERNSSDQGTASYGGSGDSSLPPSLRQAAPDLALRVTQPKGLVDVFA